uniref:alpha-1,6-mannosyl-glycoprotein 6-beta-N-acetylglucosaminyltransferase n=1 Tax=Schistosoma mansoni TaxID=6183 RepID=A0A3Q0KJT2_SCHMA
MANHFFYGQSVGKNRKKYRVLFIVVICFVILTAFWVISNDHKYLVKYKIDNDNPLQKHTRALDYIQNMSLDDSYSIELNKHDRYDGQTQCDIQRKDLTGYPECLSKIEWLRRSWQTHSCYAELGVDGSECSIFRYLSEVEGFCPIMDNRKFVEQHRKAQITRELNYLLDLLPANKNHLVSNFFMRERVKRIWPDWLAGIQHYINGVNFSLPDSLDHCKHCSTDDITCFTLCQSTKIIGQPFLFGRPKLNILLHLEFLSDALGDNIFETHVSKGGPLGELVQWTDLITALYILGHNLTIIYEATNAKSLLSYSNHIPCLMKSNEYDLIYTDITGFKRLSPTQIRTPLCKFRILDTFGTEAQYNRKEETWGGLHLNLQQFYTFFPHSPDNTFLGFVTEIFPFKSKSNQSLSRPMALVYGKESYMWKDKTNYLRILSDYFEIHGNVLDKVENLPKFVHIHQIQYGQPYLELMSKAQIMIGLGFPYEGPAPLEAIANGLIFLNPRFNPPHSRSSHTFFADKPTSRGLTSQHPYIENHISEPYSYLIDMGNETQIRETAKRILTTIKSGSYRPHEFTPWGLIERLNAYLTRQNICATPFYKNLIQSPMLIAKADAPSTFNNLDVPGTSVSWPPESSLKIVLGSRGKSCADVCMNLGTSEHTLLLPSNISAYSIRNNTQHQQIQNGYIYYRSIHSTPSPNLSYLYTFRCSPEHFPSVNHRLNLQYLGVSCPNITYKTSSMAPYWDNATRSCVFQANHEWFDCTASGTSNGSDVFSRFCPCRDALPNQISLCSNCL